MPEALFLTYTCRVSGLVILAPTSSDEVRFFDQNGIRFQLYCPACGENHEVWVQDCRLHRRPTARPFLLHAS